jgi:predicted Fe-Mo cluster-binding NifX family protein
MWERGYSQGSERTWSRQVVEGSSQNAVWKEIKMRICIPTETATGRDSRVSEHFGSSPFFTIYDDATGTFDTVANSDQHHAHGSCHPISMLGEKRVDAVVCRGMGARAVQGLREAGIKVYASEAKTVEQVIKDLNQKVLIELAVEGSCKGHSCR